MCTLCHCVMFVLFRPVLIFPVSGCSVPGIAQTFEIASKQFYSIYFCWSEIYTLMSEKDLFSVLIWLRAWKICDSLGYYIWVEKSSGVEKFFHKRSFRKNNTSRAANSIHFAREPPIVRLSTDNN